MRTTAKILAATLISVSLILPASAQNPNPKSVSSLSRVLGTIESPEGKAIYEEQMSGSTRPDGFGTVLPRGVTAEDVVRLILPKADPSLATLVGMKRWPYGKDMYVAFACIAPNQATKDSVIKYNNGEPICSPRDKVVVDPSGNPEDEYLMALAMLKHDEQKRLSLASTVISWSGIEGSPLGASWEHSNLVNPDGIAWSEDKDNESRYALFFPEEIYRFDFAKYAITKSNIAFGIRSGISKGYAGGGGNFQILTLFAVVDGELRAIFSEPIYYFQDIAGDWNEDGTRNHNIYEGENIVIVSEATANGYFKLLVKPKKIVKSKKKPWHKSFRWDPTIRRYVAEDA
ncbi:hypothetical protein [Methylocaldum szegediense]|uniref:hypothetical protein n=1 Tax=Methylocaldum szegediense TaxID=73780 RepID=UPI0004049C40|nr:hypothetical protein [Methylocaldum szegediense]